MAYIAILFNILQNFHSRECDTIMFTDVDS